MTDVPARDRIKALLDGVDLTNLFDPNFDGAELSVYMIGGHLDNASGDHVTVDAVLKGYQEFVLSLDVFGHGRDDSIRKDAINMASLLADIFRATRIKVSYDDPHAIQELFDGLKFIAKDCREDMHEPDNQNVTMEVRGVKENSNYPLAGSMTFILRRNRLQVEFTVRELFELVTRIY